jgi:glucose-6-phosphate 1-epimerase
MPPSTTVDELNQRFAIAGVAQITAGNGGLPRVCVSTPAATAEIYLHGAHLTSWRPKGADEVIFLSQNSTWKDGHAIRGGIPICFPWFRDLPRAKSDNPKAPAHGFLRTKAWQLESISQQTGEVVVTLTTESNDATRAWWPHDFHAALRITIGAALKLELTVANSSESTFQFEVALHTYNRVADATNLTIHGLDQTAYLDNRDNNASKRQSGDFHFTRDTDNAYLNTQSPVEILDPILRRRIRLEKQGSLTTVVWNPWQQDAAKLADLGDTEWTQFACVEAANILSNAVTLHPGKEHTTTAILTIENL